MTKILAIDLGNRKSVACDYQRETGVHEFVSVTTTPTSIRALIEKRRPDRVVIEICPIAGWVCDLFREMGIETQVAKTTEQAWRWKHVKRKTDRDDALKLAQLSALGQLKLVHVPVLSMRQWRSLIMYRHSLVRRRTQIKNRLRAILLEQAQSPAYGTRYAWTKTHQENLRKLAKPLAECELQELWRGELTTELDLLVTCEAQVTALDAKLDAIGQADERVKLLRTIPGVGPRLAETIVAILDNPRRFSRGKQVASYTGLTPRQFQSGDADRHGHISRAGNGLLRGLLVEVSWIGLRYNTWLLRIFHQVCRGSKARKKLAIVAVARHLMICCWAMLRDGVAWQGDPITDALKAPVA